MKKTILLVDNTDIAPLLKSLLRRDYTILTAQHIPDAIDSINYNTGKDGLLKNALSKRPAALDLILVSDTYLHSTHLSNLTDIAIANKTPLVLMYNDNVTLGNGSGFGNIGNHQSQGFNGSLVVAFDYNEGLVHPGNILSDVKKYLE